MAASSYTITCLRTERIARDIYELEFTKPNGFTFQPGQFVLFDVPLLENPSDIQTRALSIASSPKEEALLFIMKMKVGGRISRWIEEKVRKGTTVKMQGPFGVFMLDRETDKDYLLVATSTGVAPFRSQLFTILPDGLRRIDLVFGVRTEEDLFWHEEFQNLAKEHTNFFIHFALSEPSEEWKGHHGRVQTLVPQIVNDFSRRKVYICGSPEMAKEVKDLCFNQWGISKQDLHMEGYI